MEHEAAPSVGKVSWHMWAFKNMSQKWFAKNVTFLVGVPARDLATDLWHIMKCTNNN